MEAAARELRARKTVAGVGDCVAAADRVPGPVANAATNPPPRLRRFAAGFALPSLPATTRMPAGALPARSPVVPFEWAHATAAAIGTVTHRLLAQLAREGIAQWNGERVAALGSRIRMELRAEGVDDAQLAHAGADVDRALRNVIEDSRGRWLFDPAHADAASEWTLAGIDAGAIVHVSLDRTFVADGVRWIVDFKTGRHEGGDTAAFLAREEERYRPQLERYARIVRALDPRPIRLALYYPLVAQGLARMGIRAVAMKCDIIQAFALTCCARTTGAFRAATQRAHLSRTSRARR